MLTADEARKQTLPKEQVHRNAANRILEDINKNIQQLCAAGLFQFPEDARILGDEVRNIVIKDLTDRGFHVTINEKDNKFFSVSWEELK